MIKIEGFKDEKELNAWLVEQDKNEPNENIVKTFKWFLMKLENEAQNNVYNRRTHEAVNKYAQKMLNRKLMNREKIIDFIFKAQGD